MELQAVIEGLRTLKEPCRVVVKTDSRYLKDGMTKWIDGWKRKGWQHKVRGSLRREEVKNRDLWEQIDQLQALHHVRWKWTKGHSTDEDNNRCDVLANASARLLVDPAGVREISV
jgi:ribonuclease HI